MTRRIDPELLERLWEQHGAALELFAAQWSDAPEDCVQEAFLELVRQAKPPARPVPWLYRVVRNRAITRRRTDARRRKRESLVAQPSETLFDSSRTTDVDAEDVTQALQSLDQQHREVVVARIWGELSFEQIAEVVGASTSSAHRRYESGLKQIRERLGLCQTKNNASTI